MGLYRDSVQKKDYISASYHIFFYMTYGIYSLYQYFLLVRDKITRKIEFYCYYTFFLKKKTEIKEKVVAVGSSMKEKDVPPGIDISFSKEKKRDITDYNEAGFFVNAEPNIMITYEDGLKNSGGPFLKLNLEVEKIHYDLMKPKLKDEKEKNSTHVWFSALVSAVQNYLNNRIEFLSYENPSSEVNK